MSIDDRLSRMEGKIDDLGDRLARMEEREAVVKEELARRTVRFSMLWSLFVAAAAVYMSRLWGNK